MIVKKPPIGSKPWKALKRTPEKIFKREGVPAEGSTATESTLHSASIHLFKHILPHGDYRWPLARQFAHLQQHTRFTQLNFENALLAKYVSLFQSLRNGRSLVLENVTQVARALRNIEIGHRLLSQIPRRLDLGGDYSARFERTSSISKMPDSRQVTGCPEALWQLQLYAGKNYLGRIGFNFHSEDGKTIVSIVNIQGAAQKREDLDHAKRTLGKPFGEVLIQQLKSTFGDSVEYRGTPQTGKNAAQYRMTFRRTRTPVLSINQNRGGIRRTKQTPIPA